VTSVIEQAERPLRLREVHAAVEELLGARVPFSCVNEALSTHAGREERFCRLRYGVYEKRSSCSRFGVASAWPRRASLDIRTASRDDRAPWRVISRSAS
jgi:hypothetical protein